MNSGTFNYRTQYYFQPRINWGAPFIAFAVVVSPLTFGWSSELSWQIGQVIVTLGFLVFSVVCMTTYYGAEINTLEKTYIEYLWILGYKKGKRHAYDKIEYVYCKRGEANAYKDPGYYGPATFKRSEFDGYVKLNDGKTIYLFSRYRKKDLLTELKKVATDLGVEIIDHTAGEPVKLEERFASIRIFLKVICFFWLFLEWWFRFEGFLFIAGVSLLALTSLFEFYLYYLKRRGR